jgi:hypothetical protein
MVLICLPYSLKGSHIKISMKISNQMYICGMAQNPFYFTEAGLKTITEAISTGTLSVYYGDKRVEYRSLNDMIRTRNMMLIALGHGKADSGRRYAEFDSGIHHPGLRRWAALDGFIGPNTTHTLKRWKSTSIFLTGLLALSIPAMGLRRAQKQGDVEVCSWKTSGIL